ncbi:MAG: hypothetical protein HOF01_11690 [Chloroflexi bacterium]|jgi:hypothetical protein|nr:hypothetical protein [Chloroflexota bacterium]
MTAVRSRNGSFKILATMAMVLVMALVSACDVLATEGARDAIANGREIREFEDQNLRPLQDEMNDLYVNEIEPRERELEDLRHEQQVLQEELFQPLWEQQNDPWAPGGEAALIQDEYDEKNRQIDLLYRDLELEQRELDANWQTLWGSGSVDPLYQELEDLRYDKQRELDRLYRFGNRPIDDIWDQINELNNSQGFANTDSQIEAEQINIELRRLWDIQNELVNGSNNEANLLYERANEVQNDLTNLYNNGWEPINDIYFEIERLEAEQSTTAGSDNSDSINAQIAELESLVASYISNRDGEIAAWEAALAALGSDSTEVVVTDDSSDSSARIAELQGLIAGLQADAAALVAAKEAEKDVLSAAIDEKKNSYNQLIETAESDFSTLSASLLADAEAIEDQIDELEEVGGDDANAQIAELQPQYDALITAEQAEEDELHVLVAGYEADRDAGVDELKVEKDAVEALLLGGLTDEIDAQIAIYQSELNELLAASSTTTTTASATGTQSAEDIQASIDSANTHWNGLISEASNKIAVLQNELVVGSSTGSDADSRINSLKLQIVEMESELNTKIQTLETLVAELYRQAESSGSGNNSQAEEIQRQIDELNKKLEAIWQDDSSNNLDVMIQVQTLQKQVYVLEEEREDEQYRLEEELWDLDDKLSRFYQDQNSGQQSKETEYQAIAEDIQQRRFLLDEERWTLNDGQQAIWDALELKQAQAQDEIRKLEDEEFGAIKEQMRTLENELQVYYDMQRDLELQLREAQNLVEQKKRELEDKVFDALESAAGTVDEAGETVLTATEEPGDETEPVEPTTETTDSESSTSADGTAN